MSTCRSGDMHADASSGSISSSSSSEDENGPAFIILPRDQAEASPVMMSALQTAANLESGCKLLKHSQLVGKRFRPVVDLLWLPHSLVDWSLVLNGDCMCNHFCARSALVRKAELYKLLRDARGSDRLPVIPVTHVLVLHNKQDADAADVCGFAAQFCRNITTLEGESDENRRWLLKAGNSSNGNGIHLVNHLNQVVLLLKDSPPRDSWCLQEFVSHSALVRGCRYSVRLLLLLASSQVEGRPSISAWAFRNPLVLRCLLPFVEGENKREYLSNSLGDASVIRDCAFMFEELSGLASSGGATTFDVHHSLRLMCEHAAAAVSAALAAAAIMPIPRCFEVFAADFILDSGGRPWLLEVNADPSWALWEHNQPALQEFVAAVLKLARTGFSSIDSIGASDCLVPLNLN